MNTRNTTIKSILLLLALCYLGPAHTQILAPDFQCVVNDTLFWEPATNNCGPFVSYDIYFSADEAGPYTLLNSITDPTETFFFHSDANNQIWYYYLTSNYNCPGETQLSSDTLDNLIPIAGPLEYVSVLGGGVEISWGASPSPETIGYVISRNTDQGTTVLDTVYDTTIYLDLTAEPELQSEVYFVVALDACGNKSLVPPPHQTILLDFMPPDACNPGLVLNWTAYQNWANGVGGYDIFVGADGETPELVGSVGGAETTFTYTGGNDGELLCFYVEAIENNTGFRARSNEECTGINILQPIREIELLGASVNENGTVDLEWYWDPTALLVSADQASVAVGDDAVVVQSLTLDNPLQEQNLRQDPNVNAQNRAYIYTIFATDECGNMVNSNDSQTPFLQGVAGANSNQLSWNAYAHPLGQALNYTLIRVSDLGEETVFSGITNDLSFDDVVPSDLEGEGLCYYLLVEVEFERSNGEVLIRELRSNTVCLVPSPKVFVPNVFAPNGVNNIFRPQLSFGDLAEYELNIYDRWGGQVFQSASIDKGWDGRRNGEVMPQGVYLYFINLRLAGGETVELQGDVMLLR